MNSIFSQRIYNAISFFVFLFALTPSHCQDLDISMVGDSVQIEIIDGNIFTGKIIAQDSSTVELQTVYTGDLQLRREVIATIRVISSDSTDEPTSAKSRLSIKNRNPTFMVVSPTGFSLKERTGYYQNTMFFYNSVGYAFTDRFSINAGLSLTNFFSFDGDTQLYFFTPRYTIPVNNFINVGISMTLGAFPDEGFISIFHGHCTIGKPDTHHLTIGLSYAFSDARLRRQPAITFSGYFRITRKLAFITENWLFPWTERDGFGSYLSYGIRILNKKSSIDIVLIPQSNQWENDEFVISFLGALPVVSFVIPFW